MESDDESNEDFGDKEEEKDIEVECLEKQTNSASNNKKETPIKNRQNKNV